MKHLNLKVEPQTFILPNSTVESFRLSEVTLNIKRKCEDIFGCSKKRNGVPTRAVLDLRNP